MLVFKNLDEDQVLKNVNCFRWLVYLMLQSSVSLEQVERFKQTQHICMFI